MKAFYAKEVVPEKIIEIGTPTRMLWVSSLPYKGFLDPLLPGVDIVTKKKLDNTRHANCQHFN